MLNLFQHLASKFIGPETSSVRHRKSSVITRRVWWSM